MTQYNFEGALEVIGINWEDVGDGVPTVRLSEAHYDAIYESLCIARDSQWRPIESAPKDGTEILLYFPHRDMCIRGFWGEVNEGDWETGYRTWHEWCTDDDVIIQEDPSYAPTHWMLIPPQPTTEEVK